ncbi:MAG: ATP synthase F1 subunit gamma [Patescibacteria group bacterium]|nr:ATP synthase F1 subunit gamma [Patescibacteria group bacterium]
MPGIKELKTRIRSIQGTRKVTRAMQMVSAAKMRKAQDATLRSRTYSTLAWELILNLSATKDIRTAFFKTHPKAGRLGIILLTSNRGMVGSLNVNLINKMNKAAQDFIFGKKGEEIGQADVITYGRKGREAVVRSHKEVLADYEKFDRTISVQEIYPLAKMAGDLYKTGKYQKILVVYNHFVSTLVQKPTVKQILPFAQDFVKHPQDWRGQEELRETREKGVSVNGSGFNYIFEPDPKAVLRHLLPRIIESQIYQAILEAEASEQSARMIMMKNATDAAGDLIDDLTLTFNKMRQNKITTELAEITAGKIALE